MVKILQIFTFSLVLQVVGAAFWVKFVSYGVSDAQISALDGLFGVNFSAIYVFICKIFTFDVVIYKIFTIFVQKYIMIVFVNKVDGSIKLYGSLKVLFECEKVKIGIRHFYNTVDGDYEDEICRIVKREVVRSKSRSAEVKTVHIKETPKPINKTVPKNTTIVPGTYVKRGDDYIFNLDGDIMTLDEIKILGYKTPKNSFGNISDLL